VSIALAAGDLEKLKKAAANGKPVVA